MAQNKKFNDFVTTKMLKADSVTDVKTANTIEKTLKFVYQYDQDGGDTAAKTLTADGVAAQQLPAGAILKAWFIDVEVPFASSGSATIAIGHTGVADSVIAATAFDNGAMVAATAGWEFCSKGTKLNAAKNLLFTIGGAALTAGAANIYITYQETIV